MSAYSLQIVTPDGLYYDGQAEKLIVRTITGDVCILARHCDYVTALGMGEAKVILDGGTIRTAACVGGMLSVTDGRVRLIPTTFEWADEIDTERAERAAARAKEQLADRGLTPQERTMAEARLRRAQVRISVANRK